MPGLTSRLHWEVTPFRSGSISFSRMAPGSLTPSSSSDRQRLVDPLAVPRGLNRDVCPGTTWGLIPIRVVGRTTSQTSLHSPWFPRLLAPVACWVLGALLRWWCWCLLHSRSDGSAAAGSASVQDPLITNCSARSEDWRDLPKGCRRLRTTLRP